MVAQSPEPGAHVLNARAFGSNWNLEMLVSNMGIRTCDDMGACTCDDMGAHTLYM